jgi:hypothetical protein
MKCVLILQADVRMAIKCVLVPQSDVRKKIYVLILKADVPVMSSLFYRRIYGRIICPRSEGGYFQENVTCSCSAANVSMVI